MNLLAVLLAAAACVAFTAADDVLVYTDADFETEIQKHPVILVEFYAPWCGHCKRLAPEYESAATVLKKADPPVTLAKVDCTVETNTCSKFGVSGYPTVKIFKNGEFSKEYGGPREKDGIIKTMIRESRPTTEELSSAESAEKFLSKDSVAVVGFFDNEDNNDFKAFKKVADQLDTLRFGYTFDADVKKSLKVDEDGIVLYRPKVLQSKFEEAQVRCTETGTAKIKSFLETAALGLCAERTTSNAESFGKPTFTAYFNVDYQRNPKGTNYWRNRVMKVGKKIRDEGVTAFFAISSTEEMRREIEECGLADKTGDKPVVCALDKKNRKFQMTEEFSMDSFEAFIRKVLAGEVEPYLKSEAVPASNDEPVKVVVAKNFDEIVNNEEKDVLIEFYAPWCGHCKSLAPKYDELATKLSGESSITIAKMDATANDVPSEYEVRGFPTIFYVPKGSKSSPKKYEGGREVKDFIKYLAKESTDGLDGYTRDGKKKKKDKKEEL